MVGSLRDTTAGATLRRGWGFTFLYIATCTLVTGFAMSTAAANYSPWIDRLGDASAPIEKLTQLARSHDSCCKHCTKRPALRQQLHQRQRQMPQVAGLRVLKHQKKALSLSSWLKKAMPDESRAKTIREPSLDTPGKGPVPELAVLPDCVTRAF